MSATDASSTALIDVTFVQTWSWSGQGPPTTLTLYANATVEGDTDLSVKVSSTGKETANEGGFVLGLSNSPNCVNYNDTSKGSGWNPTVGNNNTATVDMEGAAQISTIGCLQPPGAPEFGGLSELFRPARPGPALFASPLSEASATVWYTDS